MVSHLIRCIAITVNFQEFTKILNASTKESGSLLKARVIYNHEVLPTLGEWRPASRKSSREQVVISRLRIGHTRLTHSYILKQEPQPQCLACQTTCTFKHILIECSTFAVIRKRFFKVNNLTDLFENVKIDDILSFLRETELYQKIWQLKTG